MNVILIEINVFNYLKTDDMKTMFFLILAAGFSFQGYAQSEFKTKNKAKAAQA